MINTIMIKLSGTYILKVNKIDFIFPEMVKVTLYTDANYKGDSCTITKRGLYDYNRNSAEVIGISGDKEHSFTFRYIADMFANDAINSIIVGPLTKIIAYEDASLKGRTIEMINPRKDEDLKIADLSEMKYKFGKLISAIDIAEVSEEDIATNEQHVIVVDNITGKESFVAIDSNSNFTIMIVIVLLIGCLTFMWCKCCNCGGGCCRNWLGDGYIY